MPGDLGLPVAVLFDSLDDLLVPFVRVVLKPLRKDRIECRSVGEALAFGDLGYMVTFAEMVRVAVNKFVITQEDLTFDIRPDRFFVDPPGDELAIFLCRLGPRPAELAEDPVGRETGMGLLMTRSGQVAGPFPVVREFHHAGSDRVQDNVAADFKEMRVLLDDDGLISALEEVSRSSMPVIEKLGIDAVHLAHAESEVTVRRLDEKMVVVVHEAVGMAKPAVPLIDMLKRPKKVLTVLIVLEHGFLFVATRGHMINSTGILYTKWTGHEAMIAAKRCNVNSIDLTLRSSKKL